MKLNDKIPGLPPWPSIELNPETSEYSVHGWHASYGRFVFASWFFLFLFYGSFVVAAWNASRRNDFGTMVMTFICTSGVLFIIILPFSSPKHIARWFLRKKTCVCIRQNEIIVDKKSYAIVPGIDIQFRAFRPAISERKARRLLSKDAANEYTLYPLEFRKVEMIYGSRVIDIASIDDEERAEQFAIALQIGLEQALKSKAKAMPVPPPIPNRSVEDALPE